MNWIDVESPFELSALENVYALNNVEMQWPFESEKKYFTWKQCWIQLWIFRNSRNSTFNWMRANKNEN